MRMGPSPGVGRSGLGRLGIALVPCVCILLSALIPERILAQAHPRYDLIALRVEFQPDTTRYTTGDGTFEGPFLEEGPEPSIDPLPHDAAYFEAHLAFLEHYVRSVSDSRTEVTTHLLKEIVRVDGEMGAYSPVGPDSDSDEERAKLAGLIAEAWREASRVSQFQPLGFDPDRTAFVLFHAGSGRDVELLGTLLDKTPLDLPSIFFSGEELARLGAQDVTFKGLPVGQTAILPRTESRMGHNAIQDVPVLLELSINGLMAASFFNFLGVPDLFNTVTGESAIGPFGLMDPLGIFAYAGLFPPEPSPWTKQHLGWLTPEEINGLEQREVRLATSTAARVNITDREYFLVENRNRDPEGDGLVLQVWQRDRIVEQRIPEVSDNFGRFRVDGFVGGVVVGADNYDFALPGRDADENQYEGGILIWHIDERDLREKIAAGRVNADPGRRTVDLEEADSAQDIGFDNNVGSPFDFFYAGNEVRVELPTGLQIQLYENRFGPTTTPSSSTNDGGESFVVLEDFSAAGPVMTFTYRREGVHGIRQEHVVDLTPDGDHPFGEGSSLGEGPGFLFAFHPNPPGAGNVFVLGRGVDLDTAVVVTPSFTRPARAEQGFAVLDRDSATGGYVFKQYRVAVDDQTPLRVTLRREEPLPARLSGYTVRGPMLAVEDSYYALLVGAGQSVVAQVRQSEPAVLIPIDDVGIGLASAGAGQVVVTGMQGARVLGGELQWRYALDLAEPVGHAAFGRDAQGLWGVLPLPAQSKLRVFRSDGTLSDIDVRSYALTGPPSIYPALVDVDHDGRLDILTTVGRSLVAFSQNGALASGFAIELGAPALTQPLVADLTGSGSLSVVVAATNGAVYAADLGRGGRQAPGFPLAAGAYTESTPLLSEGRLHVLSSDDALRIYALDNAGQVIWGEHYGAPDNKNFAELPSAPAPQDGASLLVARETYNWPNPIRYGQTYFRCMTTEDATIRITVIDEAGGLVDDMEFEVRGGSPSERLWQEKGSSGLYFARVMATTASGRAATKLIKMAVVR